MTMNMIPGHNTPEELLAYMVAPVSKTESSNISLPENEVVEITAMANRTEFIIQTQTAGAVWIQLNDDTPAIGRGLRLEGAFGIRVSSDVKITLVAEAAVNVFILQMGV